ncbi:MAG: twitching motility protein PilT [Acidobacteriota bacterium]
MGDLYRDPELDALIGELNRDADRDVPAAEGSVLPFERVAPDASFEAPPETAPARRRIERDSPLGRLLERLIDRRGTDLHLVCGLPPVVRVDGTLRRSGDAPLGEDEISRLFAGTLDGPARARLAADGAVDFTLALEGAAGGAGRFRVNVHRERGRLAAALRSLPSRIPTLGELNLPPSLAELVEPHRGMVLVCGPTGSGKSSTLAALVGEINRRRACHVITIEEPVEFVHPSAAAVVEHVEVGVDAPSFSAALRAALRQDPDVLLVGEMRDLESISIALTAAETGHLVLSTLHSHDVVQTVHRIVDVFPAAQQAQIRHQLSLALSAIVCQQLVPRADRPGRLPALEVLTATHGVRHLIRQQTPEKLIHEIALGRRHGMVSFEASLARLVREGKVDRDEALARTTRPDEFEQLLRS